MAVLELKPGRDPSVMEIMQMARSLKRAIRLLSHIPAERLAQEFVNEYEEQTGRTWGAYVYLADLASDFGASVHRADVTNWRQGRKHATGSAVDTAIRAAIDTYLGL